MTKKIVFVFAVMSCLARAGTVRAQAPAPDAQPSRRAGAAAAASITAEDLKAAVKPTDRANGDPDGSLTGTANDIAISDAEGGPDADRRPQSDWRQPDRRQLRVDAALRLPDHVHAGGVRRRRSRACAAPRTPTTR